MRLPLLRAAQSRAVACRMSLPSFALLGDVTIDQGPEGSQPVSALFEDGLAIAYLGVLTVLFGFLAYLALADRSAKKRREESLYEMQAVSENLRREGKDVEAAVLEGEMQRLKSKPAPAPQPKPWEPGGIGGAPLNQPKGMTPSDEGNRFMRRQQKARRKKRK
eukprot:1945480-Prymnesium_polylepis.1